MQPRTQNDFITGRLAGWATITRASAELPVEAKPSQFFRDQHGPPVREPRAHADQATSGRGSAARTALALLFAAAAYGQSIEVGPNVRVTDARVSHVEPHIAAHPRDARKLLVSVSHFEHGATMVETFSTRDAGTSWSQSPLPGLRDLLEKEQIDNSADTRVAYAPDGEAYCVLITVLKGDHPWGRSPILFYRSSDNGTLWKGPTRLGPLYDRPTLLTSGNTVYIAVMTPAARGTAAALLRSTDRGASFQRVASFAPDSLGHQPMSPVLSSAGTLIIPYVDFPRHKEDMHSSRIYIVRSNDAGATFEAPVFVADIPRPSPGSLEMASGRAALYLAWNGGPADHRNLTVARSTDNGENWTAKIISPAANFGSLAVAENGTLGVAWIQHLATSPECWQAYFSASIDNGKTFTIPSVISTAPSCPNSAAKSIAAKFGGEGRDYGDYMGLASVSDGTFHPVWLDARDGVLEVYTSSIKIH